MPPLPEMLPFLGIYAQEESLPYATRQNGHRLGMFSSEVTKDDMHQCEPTAFRDCGYPLGLVEWLDE